MNVDPTIDTELFRHVLGHYPTGVCVVTAAGPHGADAGMVVGSFTSVSLDPPLIGIFPDKRSTTWPVILEAGKFCINILSRHQRDLCRRFSLSGGDKFSGLVHRRSETGSPILDGVVAWIDCSLQTTHEAGDHYIAIGQVLSLDIDAGDIPLLFFQGGYGEFSSLAS